MLASILMGMLDDGVDGGGFSGSGDLEGRCPCSPDPDPNSLDM